MKFKYIIGIASGLLLFVGSANAQAPAGAEVPAIPISIFFSEQSANIPQEAVGSLTNKMRAAAARNGLGATDDNNQFFLTCQATVEEKYVIPGPPPQYFQKLDLTFYVVDSFTKKIFDSVSFPSQGVDKSETKSYLACFRAVNPSNPKLGAFLKGTAVKIANYYEEQLDNIITRASNEAKAYNYASALAILSQVPEAIPSYWKVMDAASEIYQKYIDDEANRNLAKARSVWNAGQDAAAAAEAGEYLALILPDATCYPDAMKLSDEMKARVKSDIDYYRKRDEKREDREYDLKKRETEAWRAVGVAYGNNQKANAYYNAWLW